MATDILKVHGPRLTKYRIKAGLALSEVARLVGDNCNKSSVSRWEQELLAPSQERIEKLAEILGTRKFIYKRRVSRMNEERDKNIYHLFKTKKHTQVQLAEMNGLSRWTVVMIVKKEKQREREKSHGE